MMRATQRARLLLAVLAVALLALLAGSVGAEESAGEISPPSYTCDSENRMCSCDSFFDCKKMKDKVCTKDTFGCSPDGLRCSCAWKGPIANPKYDIEIDPKAKMIEKGGTP